MKKLLALTHQSHAQGGQLKSAWVDVDDESVELDTLYDLIQTNIVECVQLPFGVDIWADEEGLLKPNPVCEYAITDNPFSFPDKHLIAGNVVFAGRGEEDTVGLTEEQVAWLVDALEIRVISQTQSG